MAMAAREDVVLMPVLLSLGWQRCSSRLLVWRPPLDTSDVF